MMVAKEPPLSGGRWFSQEAKISMKSASSPIKREEMDLGRPSIQRPLEFSTSPLKKDGLGTKTKNGSPLGKLLMAVQRTQFTILMWSHSEQRKLEFILIEHTITSKTDLADTTGGSRRSEDFLNHCKIKS